MPFVIPPVDISEFTSDVVKEDIKHTVSGSGIFDDMMETATKHLQAQFEGNRIRGEMYAQAYIQIYIETLRTAMQIWLQKPEQDAKVALLDAQKENVEADTLLKGSQKLLTDAQKALVTAQAAHEPSKKANTEADTDLKIAQKAYIQNQAAAAAKDEALKTEQINSEKTKTALYKRQIEGYDENYKEKILKIVLDAFTVVFSVASEGFRGGLPKAITVSGINKITDIITKDLNLVAVNDPNNSNYVEKIRNGNVTI